MEIISKKRTKPNAWKSLSRVAFIGNHLPRQCGIATFTTDLADAVDSNTNDIEHWVIAINDRKEGYAYPPVVKFEINQNQMFEYSRAADFLNTNQIDAVSLQHEYGIFGGKRGVFIIKLLRELTMPIVTTLHTILTDPDPQQRAIMSQLIDLSDRLVVMSNKSVALLKEVYDAPEEKIVMIPHGIHDIPFAEPSLFKGKFGLQDKKVILSFGLLSPSKGIEFMIEALPLIKESHPDVIYMVTGATHPHLKASNGEEYRLSLHRRAQELGVAENVVFHDRFVSVEDLKEFIGAADIYTTPYLGKAQIISGTLIYAMGMGKAVVSTPYYHAEEVLADGRGRLVPFKDSVALAKEIIDLLDNPDKRNAIREKAYLYCRDMVWKKVGAKYLDLFAEVTQRRLRTIIPETKFISLSSREQRLPDINLNHLRLMTDGTGMLQHAKFSVPNRNHGYCVDDNARALIVTTMAMNLLQTDNSLDTLSSIYLSFLDHAFSEESGRFRNFMSYERKWLEEAGSEDSHGRAVWSLGVTVGLGQLKGQVTLALDLFRKSLATLESFTAPRAMAFALIGIHEYLSQYPNDIKVLSLREKLANQLLELFNKNSMDDWPWLEDIVTYDNARIPQALLLSGQGIPNSEMHAVGLRSLEWLKAIQTDKTVGFFSPVGNDGWYRKGDTKANFDHQPLEAAAMIDACKEAYSHTRDEQWRTFAYKCLNWFQGENAARITLYDPATGGCRDGVEADGVNENQGAESTLSWLLSLLSIYSHFETSIVKVDLKDGSNKKG